MTAAVPQGFSRSGSTGFLAYRLARSFARALDRRLAEHGVPVGQFRMLLVLWEAGPVTQTQLAHYLEIEQPTAANTLARMERDGLVHREPDPADRRRALVHLTERGRALRGPLTAAAAAVNAVAVGELSAEDVDHLHALLGRLADRLDAEAPPAT